MSFLFYMQPAQTTCYLTEKSAFTFAIHAKQHATMSSNNFHKRVKKNTTKKKKNYMLINASTKWITMQGSISFPTSILENGVRINIVKRRLILQQINNYTST